MSDSHPVILETMDGSPITKRTARSSVKGTAAMPKPLKGQPFIVMYDELAQIDDPSPGMISWPTLVEHIGNEYRYYDEQGRHFRVIYSKKD